MAAHHCATELNHWSYMKQWSFQKVESILHRSPWKPQDRMADGLMVSISNWRWQHGEMKGQRHKGKVSDWCHCALTPLIMSARSSFSHVSLSNYPSHDSTPKSSLSLFSVFFTPLTSSSLLSCVTQYRIQSCAVRLHVVMGSGSLRFLVQWIWN